MSDGFLLCEGICVSVERFSRGRVGGVEGGEREAGVCGDGFGVD